MVLNLILTLILLPPKGGLGAQPQGFDFVSLPEGHHVQKSMLAHMGRSPQTNPLASQRPTPNPTSNPELNRLGHVLHPNVTNLRQIGDGSGHTQQPAVGTR